MHIAINVDSASHRCFAIQVHSIRMTIPAIITMGSAHSGGINVVFRGWFGQFYLSYDIDLETFNRLGNRSDGEVIRFLLIRSWFWFSLKWKNPPNGA